MQRHNSLLDIDVTLHADTSTSMEHEPEKISQKSKGKIKSASIQQSSDLSNVPRAQVIQDDTYRENVDVDYDDNEIEREKQS